MTGKVQQDEKIELSIASGHHISPSPKPAIESLLVVEWCALTDRRVV